MANELPFKTAGRYIPNKILQPDGSVIDFWGNLIEPADKNRAKLYKDLPYIANKVVNADGTVSYFIN
jgi:hypothetical protein